MRPGRGNGRRRGGAVVELAVVAPIFASLIMGQIESSRLGMVSQLLSTAAREGCRVAIVDGNTNTDVTNRINSVLAGGSVSGVVVTQTPADCRTVKSSSDPNTITVRLEVDYSNVSWVPTPFFLKDAEVSASATMSSERP